MTTPSISYSPSSHAPLRAKDEVFWTELEIRRLGNLVSECIHARRYIGHTTQASEERALMNRYIEAMKKKSMRVLHRADLYAKSGHAAWPGIDPTITDPVSLADEYVRVVENYDAVLREEEEKVRKIKEEEGDMPQVVDPQVEDWEKQDDQAYKDALKREMRMSKGTDHVRNELLEGEGIRKRKTNPEDDTYSKEDEDLMKRHQPVQDELTANLVKLVGQLKESVVENRDKMEREKSVIDQTEEAVERNLAGMKKQRENLAAFSKSNTTSWWIMLIAALVIIVVFIAIFLLLRIPV